MRVLAMRLFLPLLLVWLMGLLPTWWEDAADCTRGVTTCGNCRLRRADVGSLGPVALRFRPWANRGTVGASAESDMGEISPLFSVP